MFEKKRTFICLIRLLILIPFLPFFFFPLKRNKSYPLFLKSLNPLLFGVSSDKFFFIFISTFLSLSSFRTEDGLG